MNTLTKHLAAGALALSSTPALAQEEVYGPPDLEAAQQTVPAVDTPELPSVPAVDTPELPPAPAESPAFEISGQVQCGLASKYYLQKVHVVVSDEAQGQCDLGLSLDTDIGEFSATIWETRGLGSGERNETDYIAQYKPNENFGLRVARYNLPGTNDITQFSVQHQLGEFGTMQAEALIRDEGQPGGVISYSTPKDKREFLGGNLAHGPSMSWAKRPISGDELVNMRYNASLSWPVAEDIAAVLSAQAGAPLWADDDVDKDPQLQVNFNLKFEF